MTIIPAITLWQPLDAAKKRIDDGLAQKFTPMTALELIFPSGDLEGRFGGLDAEKCYWRVQINEVDRKGDRRGYSGFVVAEILGGDRGTYSRGRDTIRVLYPDTPEILERFKAYIALVNKNEALRAEMAAAEHSLKASFPAATFDTFLETGEVKFVCEEKSPGINRSSA